MSKIRKTPNSVAAPLGVDSRNNNNCPLAQANNTTFSRCRQVEDFLLEGEVNALPMRELARLLNTNEREIRKLIERERGAGGLILSSDKGYYLPSPDNAQAELRDYIRRVDSRMRSNRIAVKRLKRALKELEAQDGGQSELNI